MNEEMYSKWPIEWDEIGLVSRAKHFDRMREIDEIISKLWGMARTVAVMQENADPTTYTTEMDLVRRVTAILSDAQVEFVSSSEFAQMSLQQWVDDIYSRMKNAQHAINYQLKMYHVENDPMHDFMKWA